jgi:hypothetical protein
MCCILIIDYFFGTSVDLSDKTSFVLSVFESDGADVLAGIEVAVVAVVVRDVLVATCVSEAF